MKCKLCVICKLNKNFPWLSNICLQLLTHISLSPVGIYMQWWGWKYPEMHTVFIAVFLAESGNEPVVILKQIS